MTFYMLFLYPTLQGLLMTLIPVMFIQTLVIPRLDSLLGTNSQTDVLKTLWTGDANEVLLRSIVVREQHMYATMKCNAFAIDSFAILGCVSKYGVRNFGRRRCFGRVYESSSSKIRIDVND